MRRAFLTVVIVVACGEGFTSTETAPERERRCNIAADCDESPTPCKRAECVEGQCRYVPVEAGRLPEMLQKIGDCQSIECDGEGDVIEFEENGDKPEPTDDCFQNDCSAGEPIETPLSAGTPCGSAQALTCDEAGQCHGCIGAEDCASDLRVICCEGVCCRATQICQEGVCVDTI